MSLTNRIKALMKLTNTKQSDIAKNFNTSQANISKLIAHADTLRLSDIQKIVTVAGGKVELSIVLPDGTKL